MSRRVPGEPLDALVMMPTPDPHRDDDDEKSNSAASRRATWPPGRPGSRELPAHKCREIAHFFDIHHDLDPRKHVWWDGCDGARTALQVVARSRAPS